MKYSICRFLYKTLVKPLFFLFDPERIHDGMTTFGSVLGSYSLTASLTRKLFSFGHPALVQELHGITFQNPVGLSEGFDKDAHLVEVLDDVGFGFTQVGSITQYAYEGNPKPRLVRLPKSKSILVNYGLKSDGARVVLERLQKKNVSIPISISIAKTNSKENASDDEAIKDYVSTFRLFADAGVGDFFTINISCPNTYGGEPFTTPERLDPLLNAIKKVATEKPIFVKMPINLPWDEFNPLLEVIVKHDLTGVIIGNLNKDRASVTLADPLSEDVKGNLSGLPTQALSNELISQTYKAYGQSLCIIGVGGIFSAHDAYEKIKRGASLVQLITGMIFEGPQLIGTINQELVQLLYQDNYKTVSEAVGAYHR